MCNFERLLKITYGKVQNEIILEFEGKLHFKPIEVNYDLTSSYLKITSDFAYKRLKLTLLLKIVLHLNMKFQINVGKCESIKHK